MYQAGSEQAAKASKYSAGIMEKATRAKEMSELLQKGDKKGFLKVYFENVLESEAKTAENLYITNIVKGRPTVVNDAVNNPKSLNYIIIGLGAVVVILIAITLVQSKK